MRGAAMVAALGATIALALVPVAPPGVPIMCACAAALIGLWPTPRTSRGDVSEVWITIAGLVVTTAAIKAAGPVLLGGRELPGAAQRVVGLIPPGRARRAGGDPDVRQTDRSLVLDERALGVLGAGVLVLTGRSALTAIVAAAIITALARLVLG